MKTGILVALALVAVTVAGCCPGTMLGNGAQPVMHAAQVAPAPAPVVAPPVDSDGDGVVDRIDRCPDTPKGCAVDEHGCPLDQDGDGVCDSFDKCPNTPRGASVNGDGCSADQLAALAPPPAPAPPPVSVEQELTTTGSIRLENVYFETNSARLTPDSTAPLDEAGAALAKYPALKVEVEGHTDVTGKPAYNRHLSQARAETVRAYLLRHAKLKKARVTAKGYGSAGAAPAGSSPEQLKQDRRVVLRVLNPEALPKSIEVKH